MFQEKSVSVQSQQPRHPRRATRLMWVFAAAAAVTFGAGAGFSYSLDGPATISATPEDPCLMNHTCGEENQIPGVEAPGEAMQQECSELRDRGIFTPECEAIP